MRWKQLPLLIAGVVMLAACGSAVSVPSDPDAPILQIRTDGGFAPIEWILSNGPTYTLLADGRLIVPGPAFEFYPGPIVLNYQVSQVGDQDFEQILDLVAEMGLPEMTSEIDDSAAGFVADAGTTMVSFWDDAGVHQYSVYALGIELDPENPTIASNPETAAFMKLIVRLDKSRGSSDSVPYEPERVRVLAGVAMAPVDPGLEDVRPWPLGDDDPANWEQLELGWACSAYGPEALELFQEASEITQWMDPDPMMDAPPYTLLVRPLHPGEEDCVVPSP